MVQQRRGAHGYLVAVRALAHAWVLQAFTSYSCSDHSELRELRDTLNTVHAAHGDRKHAAARRVSLVEFILLRLLPYSHTSFAQREKK